MRAKSKNFGLPAILFSLALMTSAHAGRLTIETEHAGVAGWPSTVSITADSLGFTPGRFKLLLAVDQAAAGIITVEPGSMVSDCGWEYFNYLFVRETLGTYYRGRQSYVLQIECAGGSSSCVGPNDPIELARVRLWNSHHREYDCQFVPVRFFWLDCTDNIITNLAGDTIHMGGMLAEFDGDTVRTQFYAFPGPGLPDDSCGSMPGATTVGDLRLGNGGVDRACIDWPLNSAGDINLNGFRFEPADAVLFARYFLNGIGVFWSIDAQVAQTDVNGDGLPLTFSDFQFLLRVISGYNFPNPKLSPSSGRAVVSLRSTATGPILAVSSDIAISAAYLRLAASNSHAAHGQPLAEHVACGEIGDTTTVLLADLSSLDAMPSGRHDLVQLDRDVEIAQAEFYDADGRRIATDLSGVRPNRFDLYQNYPNPFNPRTTMSFNLPERGRWKLDIFNTLGQTVRSFEGTDIGMVNVVWEGDNAVGVPVSSGVYYYRLQASGVERTLPMVLMK